MKRILILTSVLSLSMGAAVAAADGPPGAPPGPPAPPPAFAIVTGTIVSVDVNGGTFVANAWVMSGRDGGSAGGDGGPGSAGGGSGVPGGPTATQVTISTSSATRFIVDGNEQAGLSSLAAGQRFWAKFSGSPADGLAALLAGPALAVYARTETSPPGSGGPPENQGVIVGGTIVSIDQAGGTFVADAFIASNDWGSGGSESGDASSSGSGGPGGDSGGPGSGSGGPGRGDSGGQGGGSVSGDWLPSPASSSSSGPATTQVTISTNPSTVFDVNDNPATFADLSPGQRFFAKFAGSASSSLPTLVSTPALAVYAQSPRTLYAFVGMVTNVSTATGTVTVNVTASLPAGLVPGGSGPQTFSTGPNTLIFGGTSTSLLGNSLGNVTVGDVVAGGMLGDGGMTLSQVEAAPLQVLIDFPLPSSGSQSVATARATAQKIAMRNALAFLRGGAPGTAAPAHGGRHRHGRRHSRRA